MSDEIQSVAAMEDLATARLNTVERGREAEIDEPQPDQTETLLTFRVARVWLGVPAEQVADICDMSPVTAVPRAPDYIAGVFSLRGHVVPLLDLQHYLDLPLATELSLPMPHGDQEPGSGFSRIAVVDAGEMRVGLLCDQVRGVVEVQGRERRQPLTVQGQRLQEFVVAEVEQPQGLLLLLDLTRLLHAARIQR